MKVAEHIAERLVDEGVEVVFTVPGEQMDALFAALSRTPIRVVQTRHEQGAAYLAFGYARSTGKIGVFTVISGPGVLNATAGLATGYAGDVRMLCIASQIPSPLLGRGYGVPHEIRDQLAVLRAVTGWADRLTRPGDVASLLGEAFHRLNTGRPRPVAIEIPNDYYGAEATDPAVWQAPAVDRTPDPASVDAALALLDQARTPMMVVGSGARAAAAEVTALAERLLIPVTSDMGGRGILSDRSPLALSYPVAHRLWPEVDVVLAVGTRFMRPQVEWGLDDRIRVIRVDLDPEEIHRVAPPAVPIVADARETLLALLDRAAGPPDRQAWQDRAEAARKEAEPDLARVAPQIGFLDAIRAALPDDGFFVDELTQVGYVARVAFPVYRPSTFVPVTYQGALGCGFATALGVQLAHPGAAVVSISGDGGFLFTATELATAVQQGLPVVAVVFNDDDYGNVSRSQLKSIGARIGTRLRNPDFVAFAQAFGARGVRAAGPAELTAQIRTALRKHDRPTVIEVPVGELPNPWHLIRLPRVRRPLS